MRKNAFEILRSGWRQMDEAQWQQFLATAGSLSQKQRRQLVVELRDAPTGRSLSDPEDQATWLRRFMGSFTGLSAAETKAWWKVIERTQLPATVAMDKGLNLSGMDPDLVPQTLRIMAGSFPGPCFRAWKMLDESTQEKSLELVILGLLRSGKDFQDDNWQPELRAQVAGMDGPRRRRIAVVLFSYVEDEYEERGRFDLRVVEDLLDLVAPAQWQVLTAMKEYVSDPCGLLPPRLAQEEVFRIEKETAPALNVSRVARI